MRLQIEQHNVTATQYNVSMFRIIEKTSVLFGFYSSHWSIKTMCVNSFLLLLPHAGVMVLLSVIFPGIMILLFPLSKLFISIRKCK